MGMEKIKLIIVSGPTASGKTGLGVELAKALKTEVVSADSMQIYKGIPIATAQPDEKEMDGVPHHMMGFLEVGGSSSLADYLELAHQKIKEIWDKGKIPILVGGTGLYIDSLSDDVELSDCGNTEIRARLERELKENGAEALYDRLKSVDPAAAEKIEVNNTRRVIRALEVYEATGIPFSRHNDLSKAKPSRYETVRFFINWDREKLYERINKRVEIMLQNGLLKEAEDFRFKTSDIGSGQAIGHKEMYPYLDGDISLKEATENLQRATRRYAKRQITWFSKREDNVLLYPEKEDIKEKAINVLKERGFI